MEDGDGVGFHFFNEAFSVMDKQFRVEFSVFHTLEIEKHEIRKSFLDSPNRFEAGDHVTQVHVLFDLFGFAACRTTDKSGSPNQQRYAKELLVNKRLTENNVINTGIYFLPTGWCLTDRN